MQLQDQLTKTTVLKYKCKQYFRFLVLIRAYERNGNVVEQARNRVSRSRHSRKRLSGSRRPRSGERVSWKQDWVLSSKSAAHTPLTCSGI